MDNIQMYPLDDRYYSAQDVGMYHCTRTSGVFSAEENLRVSITGDFEVSVSQGMAWLRINDRWGAAFAVNENTALEIEQADGRLDRYDAITISYDRATQEPNLKVKAGEYATDPLIPKPTNDDYYVELVIAAVYVPAGATSVSTIVDTRLNAEYCGIMRDGVTGIPTQDLFDTWQAAFDEAQNKISHYWQSIQNEGYLQPDAQYEEIGARVFDAINANRAVFAPQTIYLSPNGDDTSADGSEIKPYKTLQAAYDSIPSNWRCDVFFNFEDGTYSAADNERCILKVSDNKSISRLTVQGNNEAPSGGETIFYGTIESESTNILLTLQNFKMYPNADEPIDYPLVDLSDFGTLSINGVGIYPSKPGVEPSISAGVRVLYGTAYIRGESEINRARTGIASARGARVAVNDTTIRQDTSRGLHAYHSAIITAGTLINNASTPTVQTLGGMVSVDGSWQ